MATDMRSQAPSFVRVFNPIARRILNRGPLLGPNALITVRGRKSGLLRTTPIALVEIDGRRWIIGTFGDVNWVRNLRAAGQATLTTNRRAQPVTAVELSTTEAAAFYRGTLMSYVRGIPLGLGRFLLSSLGASDLLTDPDGAAQRHAVFELRPQTNNGSGAAPAPMS